MYNHRYTPTPRKRTPKTYKPTTAESRIIMAHALRVGRFAKAPLMPHQVPRLKEYAEALLHIIKATKR